MNSTILIGNGLLIPVLIVSLALGSAIHSTVQPDQKNKNAQEKTKQSIDEQLPFACSLAALSTSERARHGQVSRELHAAVTEVKEMADGYSFGFTGSRNNLAMISEWISLERLCCPFFKFKLEVSDEACPIVLNITGRDGVKEFMRFEFGLK